jgi:hypothetical protein
MHGIGPTFLVENMVLELLDYGVGMTTRERHSPQPLYMADGVKLPAWS